MQPYLKCLYHHCDHLNFQTLLNILLEKIKTKKSITSKNIID